MVEYDVDYLVHYKGEIKFTGADESRKRTVILTKAETEGKTGKGLCEIIKRILTMYFSDANGLPSDWVNVTVLTAVRVSA